MLQSSRASNRVVTTTYNEQAQGKQCSPSVLILLPLKCRCTRVTRFFARVLSFCFGALNICKCFSFPRYLTITLRTFCKLIICLTKHFVYIPKTKCSLNHI